MSEIVFNLLMSVIANPVDALVNANYIGILFWAVVFGIALKQARPGIKEGGGRDLLQDHRFYDSHRDCGHFCLPDFLF